MEPKTSRRLLLALVVLVALAVPASALIIHLGQESRDVQENPPPANTWQIVEVLDPNIVNPPITRETAIAKATALRSAPPPGAMINLLRHRDWSKIVWSITWQEDGNPVMTVIDAYSGVLVDFTDWSRYVGGEDHVGTGNQAIAYATSELAKKGIILDQINASSPTAQKMQTLFGDLWLVIWSERKQSIPVLGGGVKVSLDPNTCNATLISNIWQDTGGIDTSYSIPQDQAIQIARQALQAHYGLPPNAPLLNCTLVIRQANSFWDDSLPLVGSFTFVYTVTFQDSSRGPQYNMEAWVDAHNGGLVGGDQTL